MRKTDDRDRSVDRLLEAALRARHRDAPALATAACLEAETIAAWSDGALSVSEARAVEAHLSSCPHCQQIAAVFAQSAPAAAPAAAPWWRRPQIRWLTPALAGAAAVALVVWTSSPTTPEPAKTTPPPVAQNEPAPQRAESERSAPAAVPSQARTDEQAANAAARMREELQRSEQGQRAVDAKAALARQQQDAKLAETPPTPARGTVSALPPPPVAAPLPPPEPPARPTPPPAAEVTIPLPGRVAGGVTQKGQMADAIAFRAATMVVVAEFSVPVVDQRFATTGGAGGRGGAGAGVAARQRQVAVSPNPPVRWRVLVTGVVEKSVDGGVSWTQATIEPPLPITGGAAPQPLVCWLIGRGGVVLRSTDGVAFGRVVIPETSDLSSISAVNELEATITTATGRVLSTNDGGRTWRVLK